MNLLTYSLHQTDFFIVRLLAINNAYLNIASVDTVDNRSIKLKVL